MIILIFLIIIFFAKLIMSMCMAAKKADEAEERFMKENAEEIHIKDNIENIKED